MVDEVQSTIQRALAKLRADKARIDRQVSALQAALAALVGSNSQNGAAPVRSRRKMSAAARKAFGEKMKAYWAKRRAAQAAGKRKASK